MFTAPHNTTYKCECWGAKGGNIVISGLLGGCGAYVSGTININHLNSLYIYVGQSGYNPDFSKSNKSPMAFNGGGQVIHLDTHWHDTEVGTCGGGATDIRLTNGDWDSFNSLKSRILVAAGGGGGGYHQSNSYRPGVGGGLNGQDAYGNYMWTFAGTGGTQTAGGIAYNSTKFVETNGLFGKGGKGYGNYDGGGGGGSGYYGGSGGIVDSGSGGSSFISGHTGCNAISSSSTSTNIVHTGQPNHYSGYVFTNTVMKAGNEVMPSPTGGTETGHSGNGYCKITWMPVL